MLTLHFGPGACSLATHIVLEESGAKFEAKPVGLRKGQQYTPDYIKMNPKSKVPVLVADGRIITENVAILTYIARKFPEAKLLPSGNLEAETEALSLMAWCASGLHPVFGRLFRPQGFCDTADSKDSVVKLATEANAKNFALVNQMLAGKDWILGSFSAIDAYLFIFMHWAKALKLDTSAFPNYEAHYNRMLQRPAVQRAMAREKEAQAALDAAA